MMTWSVYILLCKDNSFYIGSSNNVEKRFLDHQKGKGGRYTRSHTVEKIIYKEEQPTKSAALKREAELKKLSRKEKEEIINI